jgi:transcriptional regulator with XRE-family HTH domain
MPERREKLARRRAAMGFTQETHAEHLGLERSTVARWEQGTGTPLAINRPDLAKALDVSPDELNRLLGLEPGLFHPADHSQIPLGSRSVVGEFTSPDRNPIDPASVVDPPWTVAGALRVLHQLAGGSVDRREFLTITGGALTGLASQWGSTLASAPLPMAPADVPETRLTPDVLDHLDHRLAELHRLDDILGGRDLCQLAIAEFCYLSRLADHAVYDHATGERLFGLVTDAAHLCGWLNYDAVHHSAAQYYYVGALRTSAVANDPLAGVHTLGRMSELTNLTGHHQNAINMLEAAEQQTKRIASPKLRSLLACYQASAYAKAGYAKACQYKLNDAERLLDAAEHDPEEPSWLYYYSESELNEHAAAAWIYLRQPRRARPLIDTALGSKSPTMVRDTAICHVFSAETHFHANDLESACDDLRAAADIARRTGSTRVVQMIHNTRRAMSIHDKEPRVQDLDRHLASLTA